MSLKSWLKFIALGILWGSSFFWIKIGIQEVSPFTLVAFRILFAFIGLTGMMVVFRIPFPPRRWWGHFLVMGLFNLVVPFILVAWSEQHIPSGLASILNSIVPLFTILLAPFFIPDDRWSLPKLFGLLVGFIGVVILMSDRVEGASNYTLGIITMLFGALSYAVAAVYGRWKMRELSTEIQAFGQMLMAVLIIWPVTLAVDVPFVLPHLPMTWLAALWMGFLGSAAGTLMFFSLLSEVGPTRTTLTSYIFPLVGVLLGTLALDEAVTWRLLAGGGLIISGVVIVNTRLTLAKGLAKMAERIQ